MAHIGRLRSRLQPYLADNEYVETVVLAQGGIHPLISELMGPLAPLVTRRRMLVFTDRSIVVVRAGCFRRSRPRRVIGRLPSAVRLTPPAKRWSRVAVLDEPLWVHGRWRDAVKEANARNSRRRRTAVVLPPTSGTATEIDAWFTTASEWVSVAGKHREDTNRAADVPLTFVR